LVYFPQDFTEREEAITWQKLFDVRGTTVGILVERDRQLDEPTNLPFYGLVTARTAVGLTQSNLHDGAIYAQEVCGASTDPVTWQLHPHSPVSWQSMQSRHLPFWIVLSDWQ
jgi:hypothetical protein